MPQFLHDLENDQTPRSSEEYLGAFTENLHLILHHNPVERIGLTVMLAAKIAMRIKAANPKLKEHDIAQKLQAIARNVRLSAIIKDLTPEEKRILQLHRQPMSSTKAGVTPKSGRKKRA